MQIDHKEVSTGNRNGETLYICDYNRPDKRKKPIRSLPPTKVVVMDNETTNKRIYYSHSHFRPLGKNGEPKSRVIPLFDNTGYRSCTGDPVYIFTTLEECKAKWNELLDAEIESLERYKNDIYRAIENNIQELKEKKS